MDVAVYSNSHALRPVDWRSRAALSSVREGKYLSPRDADPAVQQLAGYLRRLPRCRTSADRAQLVRRFGQLHDAVMLRESPLRPVVEARLLAGQSAATVAAATHVSQVTVQWFAVLFFDVGSRLHQVDFVAREVIGRALRDGENLRNVGLKIVAFAGGEQALKNSLGVDLPPGLKAPTDWTKKQLTATVLAQLTVQSETLDPATAQRTLQLLETLEGPSDPEESKCEEMERGLDDLLKSFQFLAVGVAEAEALAKADPGCVERSTDDFLRWHMGVPTPGYDAIRHLTFENCNSHSGPSSDGADAGGEGSPVAPEHPT